MRIAIVGAQGTGKTTLLNQVEKMYGDSFLYIKEIVRSLHKEKSIKINKEADFDSQMMIFEKHAENAKLSDFISDRSAIDAFVYSYLNFKKGKFSESEFTEFESIFLSIIDSYDKIFFIPIEFELKSDGFRDTDKVFQKEINDLFLEVFYLYDINFISLSGTVKERLNRFKFHINEKD